MKSIFKISFLLIICMIFQLFSGCSDTTTVSGKQTDSDTDVYSNSQKISIGKNGVVSCFNDILTYYDFKTQKRVVLCNKPNCKHEKGNQQVPTECSARVPNGGPFSFVFFNGGHLYYAWESALNQTTLYQADLDGGNRKKLCDMDCSSIISNTNAVVSNGVLYLEGQEQIIQKDDNGTEFSSSKYVFPFSVNLTTGEAKRLAKPIDNGKVDMLALYANNNKLYYVYRWLDKEFDSSNPEHVDSQGKILKEEYYHCELRMLDLSTGQEKTVRTFKSDTSVNSLDGSNVYYTTGYYQEQTKLNKYNLESGEDKFVLSLPAKSGVTVLNDEVIVSDDNKAELYNAQNAEKLAEFPVNQQDGTFFRLDYKSGDRYIISVFPQNGNCLGLASISKDDMFKGNFNYSYIYKYEEQNS